jgi:hypothetical protein
MNRNARRSETFEQALSAFYQLVHSVLFVEDDASTDDRGQSFAYFVVIRREQNYRNLRHHSFQY